MAKPKGLILEEDLVAQQFDLEEIAGVDLSDDPDLLEEIGEEIKDYIVSRVVNNNQGYGGKKLKSPYSKLYQNSIEFDLYGKDENDINMTLTGDMLGAINIISAEGSELLIGIDDQNAPKAHGHMTGKNGTVKNMKREFFGVTMDELKKEVLSKFSAELKDLKGETRQRSRTVADFDSIEAEIDNPGFQIISDLEEV